MDPHDEPQIEPEKVGTPAAKLTVGIGLLVILAVVAWAVISIVGWIRGAGPALKEDWKYIGDIRSRDAALVAAQKEAGAKYKESVGLQLSVKLVKTDPSKGHLVRVSGKVTNTGDKQVLKAAALVTFEATEGEPADRRKVVLFDATPRSTTPDRPLEGSGTRDFEIAIDNIRAGWDTVRTSHELADIWIKVEEPEPQAGE